MKTKKINLKHKGKKFSLDLKVCSELYKIKGLMFSRRKKAKALLFDFDEPTKLAIHSFFVFFPFLAIWLNDKNKILEFKIVKPFEFYILPKTKYSKLIEIPLNEKYSEIEKVFEEN